MATFPPTPPRNPHQNPTPSPPDCSRRISIFRHPPMTWDCFFNWQSLLRRRLPLWWIAGGTGNDRFVSTTSNVHQQRHYRIKQKIAWVILDPNTLLIPGRNSNSLNSREKLVAWETFRAHGPSIQLFVWKRREWKGEKLEWSYSFFHVPLHLYSWCWRDVNDM